ncbi:hypothetical protein J4H86_25940 [Spiractinospora alimapuensis]|uniref:hypothetical protein n=1 Tax=Spiractinospora alimapuensis TaxID=2820884 RepID=UPI001F3EC317|nr:hypothetical protein [Spiractinospora alimapuensis]QVQ52112.1 hypothetical protein J4H86_25940 [Spiractinospora alimapuensis]
MSAAEPGQDEAEEVRAGVERRLSALAETEVDEHVAVFDQVRADLSDALQGLTEDGR